MQLNQTIQSNNYMKFIYSLLLLSVFATACKKEEDDHNHNTTTDTSKPVINITAPSNTTMYNNGDTVKIRGTVTDNSLHELLIRIIKDSDGSELFRATPTVHDLTSYSISENWKSSVSDHTNASIIISAEDHNSNVGSDTVHIHIMP